MPRAHRTASSPFFQWVFTSVRNAANAGTSPQTSPVATPSSSAKPTTLQFSPISSLSASSRATCSYPPAARPPQAPVPRRLHSQLNTRLSITACRSSADCTCPQRQAHRHFSLPPDGPHQHQSRQVRAGNQQHDCHREKQDSQQRPRAFHCVFPQSPYYGADVQVRDHRRKAPHDLLRYALGIALGLRPQSLPASAAPPSGSSSSPRPRAQAHRA